MLTSEIRKRSENLIFTKTGIKINNKLPLLDWPNKFKDKDEVATRIVSVHPLVALSFDYSKRQTVVKNYLEMNRDFVECTPNEISFLNKKQSTASLIAMQFQVECLFTLLWYLNHYADINPESIVPDTLISSLPRISSMELASTFINNQRETSLKNQDEVVLMLDFYYCLHNLLISNQLGNFVTKKNQYDQIILNRRYALEWLVSEEKWDDIILDT